MITLDQVRSFLTAVFVGDRVDEATFFSRLAICRECPYRRLEHRGTEVCDICGCPVDEDTSRIRNLAAYEENLPHWGCKHPDRQAGAGWPR